MTRRELEQRYWRYYLLLEKRFIDTLDYTELHPDNYKSYSNNYALLMQAVGAELDTIFKIYCGYNTDDRKKITDYVKEIDKEENDIKPQHALEHPFRDQIIRADGYNVSIQPFKNWDVSKPAESLTWWNAFIKLKHNRYDSRALANQENCLNLLGALCFVEMKMEKKIAEANDDIDIFDASSELFTLPNWSNKVVRLDKAFGVLADMMSEGNDYKPEVTDV